MLAFITITFIIVLAAISPGPDFVLLTRNALQGSRRTGIYTALGIGMGTLFHATYCVLGFAIIISKSLLLFSIIKYIGASYLIYIGVKGLFAREGKASETATIAVDRSAKKAFLQGFLCNVLNPKAVMFFMALFTMVIKPNMPLVIQSLYGFEVGLIHFLWFSVLSVIVTHQKVKKGLARIQYYLVKVMGGLLVAFGIRLITLTSHTA